MKAIILADTHLKSPEKLFWLRQADADLIIHAGDYTDLSIISFLQAANRFYGVYGNMDGDQIRQLLPAKQIIQLGAYHIGLIHGDGKSGATADRALQAFADTAVDIIIFGHSHQPAIYTRERRLMLNPGSITNKRKEKWFSYIELELTESAVTAKLCFVQAEENRKAANSRSDC